MLLTAGEKVGEIGDLLWGRSVIGECLRLTRRVLSPPSPWSPFDVVAELSEASALLDPATADTYRQAGGEGEGEGDTDTESTKLARVLIAFILQYGSSE